jgi:drug/metabolite transporter (DMT)-like permease
MEKSLKADIMLIIVALFWGTSYYLTDLGLASVEVLNLNALRFLIAFALAVMLSFNKLKSVSKETILYSAGLSVILTVVYISATYGVKYTSLSNAGFLSALAVLFTPILVFLIRRIKPERKLSVSVAISFVGIALLTLNDNLTPALGDIFFFMHCLLC